MEETNHRKLGSFAPDLLPSRGQREARPSGVGKFLFSQVLPPGPQNRSGPREMGRILSPRGYLESTFRTLMKILGKEKNESSRDGGRKFSGSD
jgi:hypothetical protein